MGTGLGHPILPSLGKRQKPQFGGIAPEKASAPATESSAVRLADTMAPQTRRQFAKLALAALPASGMLGWLPRLRADDAPSVPGRPDSKVAGVQIGLNVPYSFADIQIERDRRPRPLRPAGHQRGRIAHPAGGILSRRPGPPGRDQGARGFRGGRPRRRHPDAAVAPLGPDRADSGFPPAVRIGGRP